MRRHGVADSRTIPSASQSRALHERSSSRRRTLRWRSCSSTLWLDQRHARRPFRHRTMNFGRRSQGSAQPTEDGTLRPAPPSGRPQVTSIEIRGARPHNLKGIDVDVPKHRLVAFTGVSGSGKSSLVFDTIRTEVQRQLVETCSTDARRRPPQLAPPGRCNPKHLPLHRDRLEAPRRQQPRHRRHGSPRSTPACGCSPRATAGRSSAGRTASRSVIPTACAPP